MKILQTVHDLSTKSGGLSSSVYNLVEALHIAGADITLAALAPKNGDKLCGEPKEWLCQLENDSKLGTLSYSKNMNHFLDDTGFDIYHTNGNWGLHNYHTVSTAKRRSKPFIISTHGNFYPQALSISSWKKKIAGALWVNRYLDEANAVCATSMQEMEFLRLYGVKAPIAVVPNVILIPNFISDIHKVVHPAGKRKFGFLGRLHPIKNIDRIIKAWAESRASSSEASLHIFGKGDVEYEKSLRQLCMDLNLSNVIFEGWTDGKEKFMSLSDMTVVLSPSQQENFGMTIAESLLVETPVLASLNTPWKELETYRCGWLRPDSISDIKEVINQVLTLSDKTLMEMGKRGHELILKTYSPGVIGKMMLQLYQWVADPVHCHKPQFVYEI